MMFSSKYLQKFPPQTFLGYDLIRFALTLCQGYLTGQKVCQKIILHIFLLRPSSWMNKFHFSTRWITSENAQTKKTIFQISLRREHVYQILIIENNPYKLYTICALFLHHRPQNSTSRKRQKCKKMQKIHVR